MKTLPAHVQARLSDRLESLRHDPQASGAVALQGPLHGLHRVRVGDYRILYRFDPASETISVARIGHRSTVYKPRY
jgi:mRNA interferase RelE/StbE